MSIEQLLNPRVKLSVKYPGQPVPTGTILHRYERGVQVYYVDTPGTILTPGCVFEEIVDEYPHLFKPLQWWEERKDEDMPEYIKYWDTGLYFPVERVCKLKEAPFTDTWTSDNFKPATREEYLTYINSKS